MSTFQVQSAINPKRPIPEQKKGKINLKFLFHTLS